MKNKIIKNIITIFIIIVVIIAFIFLGIKVFNESASKQKKETKKETKKEEVTIIHEKTPEEKLNSDRLLEQLLSNTDYKKIDIKDKTLNKKYNALKESLIYPYNVDSVEDVGETLLFSAVTFNIKNSDIRVDKKDRDFIYGYIKKSLLDNQIKDLFNNDNIKISKENDNIISLEYGTVENVDNKYRNAVLFGETEKDYYFRFYGAEGTWASPVLKPVPIKLVEAREYDEYILVTSKAVYDSPIDQEGNKWRINICSDSLCNNVIKEIKVDKKQYYKLNINDYIKDASTIYTIFKKSENNYYYYKNIINY